MIPWLGVHIQFKRFSKRWYKRSNMEWSNYQASYGDPAKVASSVPSHYLFSRPGQYFIVVRWGHYFKSQSGQYFSLFRWAQCFIFQPSQYLYFRPGQNFIFRRSHYFNPMSSNLALLLRKGILYRCSLILNRALRWVMGPGLLSQVIEEYWLGWKNK